MTNEMRKELMEEKRKNFIISRLNDKKVKWKFLIMNDKVYDSYLISENGDLASVTICRNMKPAPGTDGYLQTIIKLDGIKRNVAIHRLVAYAFIPNPNNLDQVNHKDGNKLNNKVSNLEWMTQHDNIIHAIETGLRDNYLPEKYSKKKIHKVCKLLEKELSVREISKKTGVSKRVIRTIRRGKSWKHISKYYNIPYLQKSHDVDVIEEQTSTTRESVEYEEEFIFS